jgi:hypothetical protein
MANFQTKIPNLGKFWRVLQWKMLEYFMVIWFIFRPFGFFLDIWYIYVSAIWYIFTRFGMLYVPRTIWQPSYGRQSRHVPISTFFQHFVSFSLLPFFLSTLNFLLFFFFFHLLLITFSCAFPMYVHFSFSTSMF